MRNAPKTNGTQMSVRFVVALICGAREGKACANGVVQKAGPNQPEIIIMRLAMINPSVKRVRSIVIMR
jgi:hypothetical protein